MRARACVLIVLAAFLVPQRAHAKEDKHAVHSEFRTSDRCVACHNGMQTSTGEDISIGKQWSATIMANSSRDPYWQGSVRRETIDHPESKAHIENECSNCHMPVVHLANRDAGRETEIFSHLPLQPEPKGPDRAAADGVTCSVCHQVENKGLGTPATFVGNVVIEKVRAGELRPEYGPYTIDKGHQAIMRSSTGGFQPQPGAQIRDPGLCGSCHTLITDALGPHGEKLAKFPEQMPYQEWQHSDYAARQTCQQCHMPVVNEAVPITVLYGQPREGFHRHVFVGGDFIMESMLQNHRKDLAVEALPEELVAQAQRTRNFLQTQAAKVTIRDMKQTQNELTVDVLVENHTGHKLPTAYPARRVWLHVRVQDNAAHIVFESGKLNPDGSIVGNDNDADPLKYEPHYSVITRPDQVEIYEPILKDYNGHVTTGLLNAVDYLKDNRLLPSGFDKRTAPREIAVIGGAADDPGFTGKGSAIEYRVSTASSSGPFHVTVELWYQPIGYRWAHNLEPYPASEPQRMVRYYEESHDRSIILAHAETVLKGTGFSPSIEAREQRASAPEGIQVQRR